MHTLELGPEEFPRPHLSIYTGSYQILPRLPHKGGIGFGQGEGQVGGPPHTAGNSFQQLLERAPPVNILCLQKFASPNYPTGQNLNFANMDKIKTD